ncbi:MAG: ABC transporter permease [Verrucomicrobia bacterium]|nr:ABC transporter permease [Verrucomicrobiota bacterium]
MTADNADPQTLNVEDRPRNAKRMDWRYWLGRREVIVLLILVAGSVIFNFTHHSYLTSDNIVTILSNVAVVAIVSIGMTMVIVTGGIDVSVGSMLALCMLMSAKTMVAGGNLVVALVVSLGVGLLVGLINGAVVAFGRIHPIIVTLGTLNIIRAVHIQILGPQWITPPPAAHALALDRLFGWPIPWWLTILLCVLFGLFMARRPLGRHVYAIGGNTEAARLAGVNVRGVIIFVYAMTGMLVGLAAVIQLGQSGTVQPNAGLGLELQVIAATVIGGASILGGKGTIVGAVLGALLVEAVHNALITIGNLGLIEGLIIGILILIAVGIDVVQNRRAISA